MVAKLNVASNERSIVGTEIRFSSGFPIVLAVFLLSAYQFFSGTMPAAPGAPTAAEFVGIAAVMILIVGIVNLRMLRSRMDDLIQDALSELRGVD